MPPLESTEDFFLYTYERNAKSILCFTRSTYVTTGSPPESRISIRFWQRGADGSLRPTVRGISLLESEWTEMLRGMTAINHSLWPQE